MARPENGFTLTAFLTHHGPGKKFMDKVEKVAQEDGLPGGMRTFLAERGMHPQVQWDNEKATRTILEDPTKPVILVSNHAHALEPTLSLAALPSRNNVSFIAKHGESNMFGPTMAGRYITVWHPGHKETEEQKDKRRARNDASIQNAITKLIAGELLYIAPDGGDTSGDWKKGVVTLIESALSMDEAYLVMVNVPDTKKTDPLLLALKKTSYKTVLIANATKVQDLPIPESVKNMPYGKEKLLMFADILKTHYDTWASSSITTPISQPHDT